MQKTPQSAFICTLRNAFKRKKTAVKPPFLLHYPQAIVSEENSSSQEQDT